MQAGLGAGSIIASGGVGKVAHDSMTDGESDAV